MLVIAIVCYTYEKRYLNLVYQPSKLMHKLKVCFLPLSLFWSFPNFLETKLSGRTILKGYM